MKRAIACACLVLTAGNLMAQNYYRAVQQAKRDSAQNDAEQQRIQKESNGAAAAAPAAPATAPAAPMSPVLQATLKNIVSLKADFTATILDTNTPPGAETKAALSNDLTQAALGTKAEAISVRKLTDDLSAALAGRKKLTAAQQTKLAQKVHALFNSSHMTVPQQEASLADVQKILTEADAPVDDVVNIVADLKEVVSQTK